MNILRSLRRRISHSEDRPKYRATPLRAELTEDNFFPLPRDHIAQPPGFVGVGCGGSGSSWLMTCLEEHPRVFPNRLRGKELHYFDHLHHRPISSEQIALYRRMFAAPEGGISGEWSPNYLTQPGAVAALCAAAPEAKILVAIRNPVDRYLSSFNRECRKWPERLKATDENIRLMIESYIVFGNVTSSARISDGLADLFEIAGRDRVMCVQFEACVADPQKVMQQILTFLELEPSVVLPSLNKQINAQLRDTVVDADGRAYLAQMFRRDVDRLKIILPDFDWSLWPDF
jgi:hypothetical protein